MIVIFLSLLHMIIFNSAETLTSEITPKFIPEDGRLNFTELARKYGFRAEEIEVETEDGYIITIFRIPGKKKPVLMVHGLGDSSNTWILRGEKSLAVALASEGYDVWCGNVRGNKYGRKHISFNPDKDDVFWDFSYHEIGFYDWQAMIERVLKETNETKLNAIGHSQGVTSLLVLLSTRPEYNDKVNLNIGLAGVVSLNDVGRGLKLIIKAGPVLLNFLDFLGINELFSDNSIENTLLQLLCLEGYLTELFSLFNGNDPEGIEPEFLPVIFGQYPAGMSKKTLRHFDQMAFSGRFASFNYGVEKNMLIYGSSIPPEYDLKKVTAKMALLYGENDVGATPSNVVLIAKALPNVVYVKATEKKEWTHVDFIWSREMDKYLFGSIIKLLNKYNW